jgi:predicted transcriptional regulator
MFKYARILYTHILGREKGVGEAVLVELRSEVRSSHRGRLDIIANILASAGSGVRKTAIMYKCNLSFRQLEVYLKFLERKALLKTFLRRESPKQRVFETTKRGMDFLKAYRSLEALMSV